MSKFYKGQQVEIWQRGKGQQFCSMRVTESATIEAVNQERVRVAGRNFSPIDGHEINGPARIFPAVYSTRTPSMEDGTAALTGAANAEGHLPRRRGRNRSHARPGLALSPLDISTPARKPSKPRSLPEPLPPKA